MSDETKIPIQEPAVVVVPPKPKVLLHEPDEEFTVKTCCGQVTSCDKPLLEFLARFAISTSVLAFCFVQLASGVGDSAYYSATVSLVLGTFLSTGSTPPPTKNQNQNQN